MTDAIEHVTDTAFWVASVRALESERTDAVFSDPLARVLVGEKGDKIGLAFSANTASTRWRRSALPRKPGGFVVDRPGRGPCSFT
ncbi:MAG: hypothetical protein ABI488_15000 [Polyangiaceae bacterium]